MDNINAAFYAWVRHMRVKSLRTGGGMYQMLVSEIDTVYDHTAELFYHPTKSLALTSYDIEEFGLEGMGEFQLDPRYINGLSATPAPKTCFGSFVPANPDHGWAYIVVPKTVRATGLTCLTVRVARAANCWRQRCWMHSTTTKTPKTLSK